MATRSFSSEEKGGFDCDFVSPPPKSLECSICLLTLREPTVISCCGNHFCQECISRIRRDEKPCPLCNEDEFTTFLHKGVMREVNALMVYCSRKELGCNWKGELGQLEKHLENDCSFLLVECSYKCGKSFPQSSVREHEIKHCPNRPNIDIQKQMSDMSKKLDQLAKKLESVIVENKSLKAENQSLRAMVEMEKKEVQELKNTIMPTPPFYFTLTNLEHHLEADLEWDSPPFYTHPRGYKMRALVTPNGEGSAANHFMSFQLALMPGEYDDELPWPFTGNVTMEICNCNNQIWGNRFAVYPTHNSLASRKKPYRECVSRAPWGITKCMPHRKLLQLCESGDMVRFRVVSVVFQS